MNKDKIIRKYLDGELTGEEEREALHLIADDPELRSLLTFDREVKGAFTDSSRKAPEVPEGFADSVMHKIEASSEAESEAGILYSVREYLQSLWAPRTFRMRPVYGAAFAVILLAAVTISFFYPVQKQQPVFVDNTSRQSTQSTFRQASVDDGGQVWMRFVYIDNKAKSIAVAGDFNDWNPEPLEKQVINGEQVWTGLVSMSRGEHRYMFVKNGEKWITDPMAPVHREDGFGNKNAVIYL